MNLNKTLVRTKVVPIYDVNGIKLHEINLPDKIIPSSQRRCGWAENNIFYKGAGIIYHGHYTTGGAKDTIRFIEYILREDFNSAWDKNIWADIVAFGYLRDLADWFKSKERKHKIGTIYALLKSMLKADKYLYEMVVRELTGLEQLAVIYQPYLAAIIVRKFCPECINDWDLSDFTPDLYNSILHDLYLGKACCHLENEQQWDFVKREFIEGIPEQLKVVVQELQLRGLNKW